MIKMLFFVLVLSLFVGVVYVQDCYGLLLGFVGDDNSYYGWVDVLWVDLNYVVVCIEVLQQECYDQLVVCCEGGNFIVGIVFGVIVGGVLGNMVGKGDGCKVVIVVGVVVGGVIGYCVVGSGCEYESSEICCCEVSWVSEQCCIISYDVEYCYCGEVFMFWLNYDLGECLCVCVSVELVD